MLDRINVWLGKAWEVAKWIAYIIVWILFAAVIIGWKLSEHEEKHKRKFNSNAVMFLGMLVWFGCAVMWILIFRVR